MQKPGCEKFAPLSAGLPLKEPLALLLLALVIALCYANTLQNPFIFDDIPNILENRHIRIQNFKFENVAKAAFESPSHRRPLSNLSFAANYYLHGYAMPGYRVVNVSIHIITAILLYGVLKKGMALVVERSVLRQSQVDTQSPECAHLVDTGQTAAIPYMTALVWALHPLQTQSVTYLVQRMNSMAALFFMAAFLVFLAAGRPTQAGKKGALYAGCLLLWILALASKEIAAVLPFCLLMYRWYFVLDLEWRRIKAELPVVVTVLIILVLLTYFFLGPQPLGSIMAGYTTRSFTLPQRLLTESRVIIFYLSLFIFPHPSRLNLDHYFPLSQSLGDPATTALSVGVLAALLVAAVFVAKKDRVVSFCILWYLGNLLIESSVIPLEIIFEHRTYLPSMALALVVVWLSCRHIKSRLILALFMGALVLTLAAWTYQRNAIWQDDLTFWEDCARKSPYKARPNNKYGTALEKRGQLAQAQRAYEQAILADPAYTLAYFNLGNVLRKQDRPVEAVQAFSRAVHLFPGFVKARNNLALALADTGRRDQGLAQLEEAARLAPHDSVVQINLADFLFQVGRIREATDIFLNVIEKYPDNATIRYSAGNALLALGRLDEAIGQYRAALHIDPSNVMVHNNLGIALAQKGQLEQAIAIFNNALKLKPDAGQIRQNLEKTLKMTTGRHPDG